MPDFTDHQCNKWRLSETHRVLEAVTEKMYDDELSRDEQINAAFYGLGLLTAIDVMDNDEVRRRIAQGEGIT
jgi:hypothetical protein